MKRVWIAIVATVAVAACVAYAWTRRTAPPDSGRAVSQQRASVDAAPGTTLDADTASRVATSERQPGATPDKVRDVGLGAERFVDLTVSDEVGRPIEGASVVVSGELTAKTDLKGWCEIALPERPANRVEDALAFTVAVSKPGHRDIYKSVKESSIVWKNKRSSMAVRLGLAARLDIKLVGPDGTPAQSAIVVLKLLQADGSESDLVTNYRMASNSDGRIQATGLSAGRWLLQPVSWRQWASGDDREINVQAGMTQAASVQLDTIQPDEYVSGRVLGLKLEGSGSDVSGYYLMRDKDRGHAFAVLDDGFFFETGAEESPADFWLYDPQGERLAGPVPLALGMHNAVFDATRR